jgi:Tol biopolymer transport system component
MRSVSRSLFVLAVSALCGAAVSALPAGATFPGHDGKFVYRTMNEIWSVSRAGENPTPIVPNANGAEYPAFSPSGDTVFFDANLDGDYDIVSVAENGGPIRKITRNDSVDWGADPGLGGHITYVCGRGGYDQICTIKADGSSRKRLTNTTSDDQYPEWSPNMRSIVFSSDRGGDFDLFIMGADGSHEHRLTTGPGNDYEPDFSPSGHKVVYSVGGDSLWVVGASGKNPHKILDVSNDTPTWSPSGDRIAFASGNDIVTIRPDGSDLVDVTSGGSAGDNIDWQTK